MKPYRTPSASAQTAKQRLQSLLVHERALIASTRKQVALSLRGTRTGIAVQLGTGDWHEMMTELAMRLHDARARSFLQGAHVQVETNGRKVDAIELQELVALLNQFGMVLDAMDGERPGPARSAPARPTMPPPMEPRQARLEPRLSEVAYPPPPSPAPKAVIAPLPSPKPAKAVDASDPSRALLIRRSVHAGQMIREKGTVVILGDIGPAAEVVAEGDVIVCGKLRGIAWAGSAGDESRFVAALIFVPTQIRIASTSLGTLKDMGKFSWLSQIARLRDGHIVIEPWGV
jgi:septum site-determining protein MinC